MRFLEDINYFVNSELYRVIKEFAEIYTDISRKESKVHKTPVAFKSNVRCTLFCFTILCGNSPYIHLLKILCR